MFEAHATGVACIAGATTMLVGHMISQMCGVDELSITQLTLVLEVLDANVINLKVIFFGLFFNFNVPSHTQIIPLQLA